MFSLGGMNYIIVEVPQTSSDQPLFCCRACLSTNGRMFNMHEHKLADAFSLITGTVMNDDQLPYLCSYCHALLNKCISFRNMCAQSHQKLRSELLNRELNTGYVMKIDPPANHFLKLTVTEVENIELVDEVTHTPADDINVIKTRLSLDINDTGISVENNVDTPLVDIKDEPNIDIVDINSILNKSDDCIQLANKIDEFAVSDEEGMLTDEEECILTNDEDIDDVSLEYELKFDMEDEHNINYKSIETDSSVTEGKEDKIQINVEKKKKETLGKGRKRKCNVEDAIASLNRVKERKRTRKEKKEAKKILQKDELNKAFERDFSVNIVVLSKEEQRKEIEARKLSSEYLESEYKCEECYKSFNAEGAYNNHRLRHNPSRGMLVCEVCRFRFPTRRKMLKHMTTHDIKIRCKKCAFVSSTKSQARLHHGVHAGATHVCPHCNKIFSKQTTKLSHIRLAHPALNLACEVCGEVFIGDKGLRMHKALTHSKEMRCSVCSAKFVSLDALARHADMTGDHRDVWPCERCGENCASEHARQKHVDVKHPVETHRCEKCNMAFLTAFAYETHVMRTHLHRGFRNAGNPLKRTYKRPEDGYMCEQCGRIFHDDTALWRHRRTHLGLKPYSCNDCSKSFTTKMSLVIHLRSHSVDKPYICSECALAFNQKHNLARHQRTIHLRTHSDEKLYKCSECARGFKRKENLARHYRTVHLGIRETFQCHHCGSTATTKDSLRVHIDSKHGGKGWPRSRKRANKVNKQISTDNK